MGAEKASRGFAPGGYDDWQYLAGMSTNPSYWAIQARRHMHEYGTTERQIAGVAFKNHEYSVDNPDAMYRKHFSMEEILTSTMITDPIRLLEICATNEGAAALVLTTRETAEKHRVKPVTLAAVAHTIAYFSSTFEPPSIQMNSRINNPSATEVASKQVYEATGIGPADIDVAEVWDVTAFNEITLCEELGFCPRGEGGPFLYHGETELGGRIPVNLSGGLICKGDPVGASHLGQVVDVVRQLRGQCGPRQVPGARTELAHAFGSDGHCAVTIVKT